MKKYCLDTNIISILSAQLSPEDNAFKKQQKIKKIYETKNQEDIYVAEISIIELIHGMHLKIFSLNNNHQEKGRIRELYPNTLDRDYKKLDLGIYFDYNKLSLADKKKLRQFEKQKDMIKFFQENDRIKKLCSDCFWEYKNIIRSRCIRSINFKNQDQSDIFIATIAIVNDLILVTENEKDFKCISGLQCENWCK